MAQGDRYGFDWFTKSILMPDFDFQNDTWKVALLTSAGGAALPETDDEDPKLGDYQEVSGTGYTAGGKTINNITIVQSANATIFDGDAVSWPSDPAAPTDAYRFLIYNATDTQKRAIIWGDLTPDGVTPHDLTSAPLNIAWGDDGILTVETSYP